MKIVKITSCFDAIVMTSLIFALDQNVPSLPKFLGGLNTVGVVLSIREVRFNPGVWVEWSVYPQSSNSGCYSIFEN